MVAHGEIARTNAGYLVGSLQAPQRGAGGLVNILHGMPFHMRSGALLPHRPSELAMDSFLAECAYAFTSHLVIYNSNICRRTRQHSHSLPHRDASSAETRPSVRSNWTIGLPKARYSMILFIVDLSLVAFERSGFSQTSTVESIVDSVAPSTRPVT